MPLYYFHTDRDPPGYDIEGSRLENLAAARNEAVQLLAEMLDNRPEAFWERELYRVTVCDEAGDELFTLEMRPISAAQGRCRV